MRMTTHLLSSLVEQLNEAQTEAARPIRFASLLKQIPGKFSKWLVDSFDPYFICFRLPNGQKFSVIEFDVYVTLDVPIGGREIVEITKSSTDEVYHEVHAAWLKEWKINQNTLELTCMSEFILAKKDRGESFKRNFIICLVNCFFSGLKNRYCSKFVLKYMKDFALGKLITNVRHYKESKAAKGVHFDGPLFFVMEADVELHNAWMESAKLQLKQQPNKDDNGPSLRPISAVAQPNS
ncbi:hypothetical protein Cgig2_013583 [Carnegiea gigantea]|uniref:Uncharacterized protein n=1 Tax=Carnegiea gigantea TaxID=171969 RepID=A0A9Q1KBP7_9CARY|nr:hypothetical protein Cgig2_013583 [Carnegiea gigantea]